MILHEKLNRKLFEKRCRQACNAYHLDEETVCCRVLEELILFADARDVGVTPHLVHDGFWESWVTLQLVDFIIPGMTCVDVGANAGYYSVAMNALIGGKGKVFAFEPIDHMVDLLGMTFCANGMDAKSIINKALCKKVGKEKLTFFMRNVGRSTIKKLYNDDISADHFYCDASTLDVELANVNVDFIKIDAEGADCDVIIGGKNLLNENKDCVVLFEHCHIFWDNRQEEKAALEEAVDVLCGSSDRRLHSFNSGERKLIDVHSVVECKPGTVWNLVAC